jgi:hypothetical protein
LGNLPAFTSAVDAKGNSDAGRREAADIAALFFRKLRLSIA